MPAQLQQSVTTDSIVTRLLTRRTSGSFRERAFLRRSATKRSNTEYNKAYQKAQRDKIKALQANPAAFAEIMAEAKRRLGHS